MRIARHATLISFGRVVVPLIVDPVLSDGYRSESHAYVVSKIERYREPLPPLGIQAE
jgi:hypothetical protein